MAEFENLAVCEWRWKRAEGCPLTGRIVKIFCFDSPASAPVYNWTLYTLE
jgi:hypothetical protein